MTISFTLTHDDVKEMFPSRLRELVGGDPIPTATVFWMEDGVLWAEDTVYNHRAFWDRSTKRWIEEGEAR